MGEFTKRKTPRLKDFDYSSINAYFITICTQNKKCILSQIVGTGVLDCPKIELTRFGAIAEKYLNQLNDFYDHLSVETFVIMPNHVHILLLIKESKNIDNGQSGTPVPTNLKRANSTLSQFISTFKRFCNKEYGYNIWQARAHDHIIRNQKDFDEHFNYILENPIRWENDELYIEE